MKAPVHRLRKDEILRLASKNCKAHGHSYLEHYGCYLKENPDDQRIGFYDIEASHLTADIGIILTYCIKPLGEKKMIEGMITADDIRAAGLKGTEDIKVVRKLSHDIRQFDILVGYYSKRFDMPFIRTRAVAMDVDFPLFGSIKHIDVYDLVKHRFKLLSNRLVRANKALLGQTHKTEIDWSIWRAAARGNKKALAYVIDHNRKDVIDLEDLWLEVRDYSRRHEVSI